MNKNSINRDIIYKLLKQVPKGKVTTYKALAKAVGHSNAARAIGMIMRYNPYAPMVPCHRVVYSDGRLGGFNGLKGVKEKARILKREGVIVKDGRIVGFKDRYFEAFSIRMVEKESLP
ncbi:MAG: MGMT family protein [Thermoproteota archaeon]